MSLPAPDHLQYIALFLLLGALPVAVVMLTPFTKISIVLMLLRQALGLQQVPGNLVLAGVALAASALVMWPTLAAIIDTLDLPARLAPGTPPPSLAEIYAAVEPPLRAFIAGHTPRDEVQAMLRTAQRVHPEADIDAAQWVVQVPAFVLGQVAEGIRIGLILYAVFVVIDLVVANVLMALGMVMLSPNTLSVPLKLLTLVASDGLRQLVHGLIAGYAA